MPLFDENGNEVSVDEVIKSQGIRDQLKEAEKTKSENEALKQQLEQARTESALTKLGVPDTGQGALVRKLIEGEPTAEKVAAIVSEYGLNLGGTETPQAPPVQQVQSDPQLDQLRQLQGAVGSSAGQTIDPHADVMARLVKAGKESPEAVMEVVREVADKQIIANVFYDGQP